MKETQMKEGVMPIPITPAGRAVVRAVGTGVLLFGVVLAARAETAPAATVRAAGVVPEDVVTPMAASAGPVDMPSRVDAPDTLLPMRRGHGGFFHHWWHPWRWLWFW